MPTSQDVDVAIVGSGPSGLAFARALSGCGLKILLLEAQSEDHLRAPAFDGREIALTHRSIRVLRELGAWDRLASDEISPLRRARVMDGSSAFELGFEPRGQDRLGALVSNHLIRRTLYDSVIECPDVTILSGQAVVACEIKAGPHRVNLRLAGGVDVRARLLVAADSRFSQTRDRLGVGVDIHRLGRSMLVCRMSHDQSHDHVATEWFDYGQTVATLPLNGPGEKARTSSIVLTLESPRIEKLLEEEPSAFEAEIERRLKGHLTGLRLVSTRHAYPMAITWSRQFCGDGFALIGDAAVGMHPVTAHGFNLGLRSADSLARRLRKAASSGRDIGTISILRSYEAEHRRTALPLYEGTHLLVRLFTNEATPARLARGTALRIAQAAAPLRRAVSAMLTDAG
ncbi:MAG: 5-demethoxyubiquinol-8 5-hydroxylase UbiM [Caulobacterales bacterium]|nr:5-demethoxyubiquinol-8 5-hydroxylase UbiM [Caulobacterales bacterium]